MSTITNDDPPLPTNSVDDNPNIIRGVMGKHQQLQQGPRKGTAGSNVVVLLLVIAILQLAILLQLNLGNPNTFTSRIAKVPEGKGYKRFKVMGIHKREEEEENSYDDVMKAQKKATKIDLNDDDDNDDEDDIEDSYDGMMEAQKKATKIDLNDDETFLDFAVTRFRETQRLETDGSFKSKANANRRPKAIIHVGPRKTGSSSIQKALYTDVYNLAKSNFELFVSGHRLLAICSLMDDNYLENQNGLCSSGSSKIEEMKVRIADAYSQGRDVVVPSEALGKAHRVNITKIKQVFSGFDVHIVVVYRRYFEWIVSNHDYIHRVKKDSWPSNQELAEKNIVSRLTVGEMKKLYMSFSFLEVFRKYQHETPFTVHGLNYQADKNIVKSFFCLDFFNTTKACKKESRKEQFRVNPTPSGAYDRIAVAAKKAGLLERKNSKATRKEMTNGLRLYFEKTVGLKEPDLPKFCMEGRELDLLRNISVMSETLAFPSFYNEEEFNIRWDTYTKTKLCSVNTTKVLEDHGDAIESLRLKRLLREK